MKETQLDKVIGKEVTFLGTARDAKGGAILLLEDNTPIYIEGLDYWSDDLDGKQVSVSGTLKEDKFIPDPVISKDGGISQGAYGTQFVLTNVKIKPV